MERLGRVGRASILVLVLANGIFGCVEELCFEDYHCPPPKVCSASGTCVYECSTEDECINGFVCTDHRCVPGQVATDAGADSVENVPWCPAGMVLVENSFCIDIYEAARPDSTATSPGTDESRAVTRKGAYPWMTKDNAVAEAACRASDKRLCEPAEWKVACSGPGKLVYSYGDEYEPETCNGIDTFGRSGFHLMPTGSFPECTNEYGVFDMNGNVWEHVADGDGTDVRGGAYNCGDSMTLHKCSYIPGNWTPSALGFRCCRNPNYGSSGVVEASEDVRDAFEGSEDGIHDAVVTDDAELPYIDIPAGEVCGPGDNGTVDVATDDVHADITVDDGHTDAAADQGPVDTLTDPGHIDSGTDQGEDTVALSCPSDMNLVSYPARTPFCMDRYEASRSDSTSVSYGTSTVPVSQPGRMPWWSSAVTRVSAAEACGLAGKRLCTLDEWYGACVGTSNTVYVYGNTYDPAVCNAIDTFCYCDTTCATVQECPYPHCRVSASPAGDGGPCGANFHVVPTGSFPDCVNEWGVYDVNGNVWEVVDAGDTLNHFRGGAYNCGDSEALHRCDHDGTWNPSAKGFRCCMDAVGGGN